MKIGFYTGSFDPFTNGHLAVVKKSCQLFDKVIIAMGINPEKKRRFDKEIMKDAIERMLVSEGLKNVEVICFEDLAVYSALEHESTFLVRGIRNGMDYEYEENLSAINEKIGGIDTIYIRAGNLGIISSSMVMELLKRNRDVSEFVPKEICEVITKK